MKVLFVSKSKDSYGISPIVKAQGESLSKIGISVSFFTIRGHGFNNYLKNILNLRNYLTENEFDIVHAHYSLSGYVAGLTGNKTPVIVSLMGSDLLQGMFGNFFLLSSNISDGAVRL